jgi:phospholipase C
MFVVSPWSTGGWVASETFDHTSIIRLMEARFGVDEPNITPWRRSVAGDLTSAFDFSRTVEKVPSLPSTTSWKPFDDKRHPDYRPTPPPHGSMPSQEPGTRPARPTPYDLDVREFQTRGAITVDLDNRGRRGVQLQARLIEPAGAPHSYTVGAGDELRATWPVTGEYDIHLHGPNGFFRRYAGDIGTDRVRVALTRVGRTQQLSLAVEAPRGIEVTLENAYGDRTTAGRRPVTIDTTATGGWYDLTVVAGDTSFLRAFAGHLETGRPSMSEPALGGVTTR